MLSIAGQGERLLGTVAEVNFRCTDDTGDSTPRCHYKFGSPGRIVKFAYTSCRHECLSTSFEVIKFQALLLHAALADIER